MGVSFLIMFHPRRAGCHWEVQLSWSFLAVAGLIKLALPAGKANPAPPVGPALGAKVGLVKRVTPAQCCATRIPTGKS